MEAALPSFREWTASTLRTCQEQRGPNSSHPGNKQPEVRLGDLACRTACHLVGSNPACGCHPAGQESFELMEVLTEKLNHPFQFHYTEYTIKSMLVCTLLYAAGIGIFYSSQKNYRRGKNMALPDGAMPGRSVRNIARSRTPRTSC